MNNKNKMPVLFIGHGSPLNALEDNSFSKGWGNLAKTLPNPRAILAISAHWYTSGTRVNSQIQPRQIYDMYGFPKEIYQIVYQPQGNPELAKQVAKLAGGKIDNSWGIDHGVWSVLRRLYPQANIPVVEMSVDGSKSPQEIFELGKRLVPLREEGVLIFASGSIIHNLSLVDWGNEGGYPWAISFQERINELVQTNRNEEIIHYSTLPNQRRAFITNEHFDPLLYALGARDNNDSVRVINNAVTLGSISMTSYLFG